jgi:hypothetical protein
MKDANLNRNTLGLDGIDVKKMALAILNTLYSINNYNVSASPDFKIEIIQ